MRLIDADKLPVRSIDETDLPRDKGLLVVLKEDIDNAPTVEEVSIIEFKEPLPPVKAQKIIRALNKRPQGEWIDDFRSDYEPFMQRGWKCTNCGKRTTYGKPPFCMYCGADMRGDKDGRQ